MAIKLNQKKIEEFQKTYHPGTCEICGSTNWLMGTEMGFLNIVEDGNLTVTDRAYPLLPVTCSKCGNTKFLNVLVAGIGDHVDSEVVNNGNKQ